MKKRTPKSFFRHGMHQVRNPYRTRGVFIPIRGGQKTMVLDCKVEGKISAGACKTCFAEQEYAGKPKYPTLRVCVVKNCTDKNFVFLTLDVESTGRFIEGDFYEN